AGIERADIVHAAKAHYIGLKRAASISAVRAEFERALDRLFVAAVKGGINRSGFQQSLTQNVNNACDGAALAGMRDAGIRGIDNITDLEDDEQQHLASWKTEQVGFIENVTAAIYEDNRV